MIVSPQFLLQDWCIAVTRTSFHVTVNEVTFDIHILAISIICECFGNNSGISPELCFQDKWRTRFCKVAQSLITK
ncbi:hypothetical protein DPMN_041286 [Dreissena polymorpha]|uniref:Uncharacterized protein n=1 Tax=Dreissena polymorpha TaxID=45954 RepID=A0A9D4CWJ6_DREPO|nr:hypothetical protein DPMN_041286 [Dreissena polymorpha]